MPQTSDLQRSNTTAKAMADLPWLDTTSKWEGVRVDCNIIPGKGVQIFIRMGPCPPDRRESESTMRLACHAPAGEGRFVRVGDVKARGASSLEKQRCILAIERLDFGQELRIRAHGD